MSIEKKIILIGEMAIGFIILTLIIFLIIKSGYYKDFN